MTRGELSCFFDKHYVFDAFQFIISSREFISNCLYCKEIIQAVDKHIKEEHDNWQNSQEFEEVEGNPRCLVYKFKSGPEPQTSIESVEISSFMLIDFMATTFFQNCRNALDSTAQAINAACLASRSKRIEKVDFGMLYKVFAQQSYSSAFPEVTAWFTKVINSAEYKYLDMYCNRVKHTCNLHTKYSLPVFGSEVKSRINPFFRPDQNMQAPEINTVDFIEKVSTFIDVAYSELIIVLKQVVPREVFVENRNNTIMVYQQKLKGEDDNSYSYAYFESSIDADKLPESIQLLLTAEETDGNGKHVNGINCPFDTIYVKKQSPEHEFVCKYVCNEQVGEDSLIRYRKYNKVIPENAKTLLPIQASTDPKQRGRFYRKNPYFTSTIVTDDDDFLAAVSL